MIMNETVKLVTDMRARIDAVIESHNTGSWQAQTHFLGDRVSYLTGTAKARPEDSNQLTRSTGTVERREFLPASPGATIGFVQYDIRDDATGRVINVNSGRVRMLDDQTRPVDPQQEQRDADHAAALEIMAMVDAQCAEANHPAPEATGQLADGDAEYIGAKPHPWNVVPGTMGKRMIGWSRRVREVAERRGMERADVLNALPAWVFAR